VIGVLQLPKTGITKICVARVFTVTGNPANNCVPVAIFGVTDPTSAAMLNVGPRFGFNGAFNITFTD
jgi:hypothetical protein